jgi:hypothetical protein
MPAIFIISFYFILVGMDYGMILSITHGKGFITLLVIVGQ